jgi:GntR family transcriptional regulator of gluconate operon
MQGVRKVQQRKLFEAVAEQLREAIASGRLQAGDKLLETELAEQFGVSRGPIREALRELSRDGLVVDLPRRGTVVSSATLGDLIEVYDVREALESFSTAQAVARASSADLERLRQRYQVMARAWHSRTAGNIDRMNADLDFHREIFRVAGNTRMTALFEQFASQTAMLLRAAMQMNPTLRISPPDEVHEGIIEALVARDEAGVKTAVAAHYRHTRDRLFAFVDEQGATGPGDHAAHDGGDDGDDAAAKTQSGRTARRPDAPA